MAEGDGGGKRNGNHQFGNHLRAKEMPLAYENSMSLSLCLLGRGYTINLTQPRNYLGESIIKEYIIGFSISTGLGRLEVGPLRTCR